MSYSKEDTAILLEKYTANPTRETVNELAERFGKSVKSVIGKLSREGVYRREVYKTKTGEDPVTKIELVSRIAEQLDLDTEALMGLEKSPKQTLKNILEVLEIPGDEEDNLG